MISEKTIGFIQIFVNIMNGISLTALIISVIMLVKERNNERIRKLLNRLCIASVMANIMFIILQIMMKNYIG